MQTAFVGSYTAPTATAGTPGPVVHIAVPIYTAPAARAFAVAPAGHVTGHEAAHGKGITHDSHA